MKLFLLQVEEKRRARCGAVPWWKKVAIDQCHRWWYRPCIYGLSLSSYKLMIWLMILTRKGNPGRAGPRHYSISTD